MRFSTRVIANYIEKIVTLQPNSFLVKKERMRNIVDAIIEVVKSPKYDLKAYSISHNRANQMGAALEDYVKDIFAGTVGETDLNKRDQLISETFCYLGNPNNPPDSMLKNGGDAIEVKKIESPTTALPLNSSYPKAQLHSDSTMISSTCRKCEKWSIRDMIYAVGVVSKDKLKSLVLVYGVDYCAEEDTYKRIKNVIKAGVESIPNVEFAETNELGRVNRVDPLGITFFRVRGMWHIENPFTVFKYIYQRNNNKNFNLMAIINTDKIQELNNFSQLETLAEEYTELKITDKQIKDPNNPAVLRNVKLITYAI